MNAFTMFDTIEPRDNELTHVQPAPGVPITLELSGFRDASARDQRAFRKIERLMRVGFWQLNPAPPEFDKQAFLDSWNIGKAKRTAELIGYVARPGCCIDQLNAYWYLVFSWCHLPPSKRGIEIVQTMERFTFAQEDWMIDVFPPAGATCAVRGQRILDVVRDMVNHCPCVLCIPRPELADDLAIPPSVFRADPWHGQLTMQGQQTNISGLLMRHGRHMYHRIAGKEEEDQHFTDNNDCVYCGASATNRLTPHFKLEHLAGVFFHSEDQMDAPTRFCHNAPPLVRAYFSNKLLVWHALMRSVGNVHWHFPRCNHCATAYNACLQVGVVKEWVREWMGRRGDDVE